MTDLKQKTTKEQHATLLVVLITNFVIPFSITSLNVAVPHIGAEFKIMATHLTWIVLSFTMTTVVLTIPCGRIADTRGREQMLKAGILLVGLAAIGNMFVPNMAMFFIMRILQGAGGAMVFATNMSIAVGAYPANRRGWVLGIAVAAVYMGSTCGPVIGGIITHHFGWRGVFCLIAVLSAVSFIAAILHLPKRAKIENPPSLDAGSILLFIVSIGLIAYGLTTLMQNTLSYIILAVGIIFTVIFVKHEFRAQTPIIDMHLFRDNPEFALSNLAALFNYAATFAIAYLMSIYLQLVKGLGADVSGMILMCQPIVQTVVSPFAGRLSDNRPPYALASLGMAFCASSLFMLAFVDKGTHLLYIIVALFLVGLGFGVFSSPNTNVIMSSVDKRDYSMATAVSSTARTFGQVICMALITIVMNVVIGNKAIEVASTSEIVLDIRISFAIFACICVVGTFISLKRKPRAKS